MTIVRHSFIRNWNCPPAGRMG